MRKPYHTSTESLIMAEKVEGSIVVDYDFLFWRIKRVIALTSIEERITLQDK